MNRYIKKLLFVFLFCCPIVIFSQTDTLKSNRIQLSVLGLEDMIYKKDTSEIEIITASRTSKNLSDLPVTIHIITHEEIIKKQYTSLIDILRIMPGVRVAQPGTGETGDYFEVRGLTGNLYTKILLNGIPIKPSVVKGMPIGAQLPIRQAERIEILYGPAAAIYGADAVAGVINIITKEADQGTFVRADISLGEHEYNYFNFTIGGKAGKNNNILKYNFYGSKTEFNDLNVKYDPETYYNPLNAIDSAVLGNNKISSEEIINNRDTVINQTEFISENYGPQYEGSLFKPALAELPSTSYMLGVDLDFKGVRLTYNNMYRRSHSSIGHNSAQYKYNNPQNYWGEVIQLVSLRYDKSWQRFSTFTQMSRLSYHMDNNSSVGLTYLQNTDKIYRYEASGDFLFEQLITFVPADDIEIVSGVSFQKSKYLPLTNYLSIPFDQDFYKAGKNKVTYVDSVFSFTRYYPDDFTNISAFTQAFLKKNKFRLMGGLRYDYNTLYEGKISPRLGILYKYSERSTARLTAGLAFKSPPPSLQYETVAYPLNHPDSIYYDILPVKSLNPERFQSVELGVATTIFWKIKTDVALYYNNISNQFSKSKISTSAYQNAVNDSANTRDNKKISWRVFGLQANFIKKDIVPSIKMDAELNLMFSYSRHNLDLDVLWNNIILENINLTPKHFGQLSLSFYPVKNLYVNVENVWESKWLRNILFLEEIYEKIDHKTEGYFTLNAMANYSIGQNLNCFLKITNLLNEKYNSGLSVTGQEKDLLYNPQLGRNIRIGLSYTLN